MLSELPPDFPVPVAIVQHRHRNSDDTLRDFLQRQSALSVVEVEDKDLIAPGRVYLAPANYHLLVEAQNATYEATVTPKEIEMPGEREFSHFALSTDTPVCHARPSIDVLFESAADTYADRTIGVILTGASQDGTRGLGKIKACGGLSIAQEPKTAESPTMPSAAIASGAIDWILPLSEIAPFLVHLCCPALT
jgi:two-component system chemotaxis response regulator CheB